MEAAVAAPLCTRHLAELGADVVKVERVGSGDFARAYDGQVRGWSAHFVWLNHGKRSLALDLADDEGRALFLELVDTADVLVSNLGPGAIDRIVDPARLRERNPRLVQCVIDGYGHGGPLEARKAYDLIVQGEAGVTANTGMPGHPAKPGVSLADLGAGVYALAGILAALHERETTGVGRRVEVALFDVVTEWMMPLLLAERHGAAPPPAGTHHASIVPYGAFTTADGRRINVAVQNEGQWQRLCAEVLDAPDLADDTRYATNEDRLHHRDELLEVLDHRLRSVDGDALTERLDRAGIPWGRCNELPEVLDHEQLAARSRWRPIDLGHDGPDAVTTLAPPLSDLGVAGSARVPALGEHTGEVLAGLGIPIERIEALAARGVVGAPRPAPSTTG